jgi:hypothetical protein
MMVLGSGGMLPNGKAEQFVPNNVTSPLGFPHDLPATVEGMERFPNVPHQSAGGGIECCGYIAAEDDTPNGTTTLRCDECGVVVGTVSTGILNDLVTLALATEMDKFIPEADHINALPGPLRKYIHDLETRADPAGDVAEIALLKENNAALWARVHELESQVPPPQGPTFTQPLYL